MSETTRQGPAFSGAVRRRTLRRDSTGEKAQRHRRAWIWAVPAGHYSVFLKTGTFAVRKVGRRALERIRSGDIIFAYLSGKQVIAGMFEAVGEAFHDTTPLIREGSYPRRLRVRTIISLAEEDGVPYAAFHDRLAVAQDYAHFRSVVQKVIHPLPKVDEKVLEFLVRARQAVDFEKMLAAYHAYQRAQRREPDDDGPREEPVPYEPAAVFDRDGALEHLLSWIEARGFIYEPWQVAAYVAALRTKPFVILAGVTGTGKSKLPALVEEATGGVARLVPVRPDWTDSADVLGYVDLQGRFRPGAVLLAAHEAQNHPGRHLTCIVDEMNLARVEQFFAEVLSRMEQRRPAACGGGYESPPLLQELIPAAEATWEQVCLPANFALAGTVNMDESGHGFSRKVLDRAFTLELAGSDLTLWSSACGEVHAERWPVSAWFPRAVRLSELGEMGPRERQTVERAVDALRDVNLFLAPAQLQVAYRTRDEVALFVLHAADHVEAFRYRAGDPVDPLDLALHMKVLPRLVGSSRPLRAAVLGLLGWATTGEAFRSDEEARGLLDAWEQEGRPDHWTPARFPRTAARLCLMWERFLSEGFTSFWL